jgi:hypothetical protein
MPRSKRWWRKCERDNISHDEEIAFKKFARIYLNLSDETIRTAVDCGILEVLHDDETQK